jgi:CRP-like cAMP-binding protein
MDKTFLIAFIQKTAPIPQHVAVQIADHFKLVEFKKNEEILHAGKVSNAYILLESGFARAYTFDTDGNEVTTGFFSPPVIVFEVSSFFKRTPSTENIRALTDCRGWQVNFETLNGLFHALPEFREFGRAVLVNGFILLKERMLSMINQTADQRYDHLLHHQPEILMQAPLKTIASYLGVTDTSLSRIRKGGHK